ncbi:rhodanese-like domain-containing protein [Hydrogenibacillus sp. N12]|uniref:rhodanese-like domain-containing protein n=1 Tax=Hydrogenibacillus sp. N12 TaxID=2866627 RepID=UPI00207C0B3F|nr:rhodanese-like domain-containing protein [Hydrogenibacillus sp. N12]
MFSWQPAGIPEITPDELKARLKQGEDLLIIDVREPMEVAMGKIPGAINIPLSQLPSRLHEIDPEKEAILVCRSGSRSFYAAQFLQANGFSKVKNLAGGMISWDGEIE